MSVQRAELTINDVDTALRLPFIHHSLSYTRHAGGLALIVRFGQTVRELAENLRKSDRVEKLSSRAMCLLSIVVLV